MNLLMKYIKKTDFIKIKEKEKKKTLTRVGTYCETN